MTTLVPVCNGTITETVDGYLQCSEAWQVMPSPVGFDFTQVDPAVMAYALGAGFFISASVMVLAWGGRIIYQSIIGGNTNGRN